jgi:hypothetical protein
MKREKSRVGRRTFLAGLATGGGVAAALGAKTGKAAASRADAAPPASPSTAEPVLFRRTAEAERYYRTLYR